VSRNGSSHFEVEGVAADEGALTVGVVESVSALGVEGGA
jgi:hypothetical protein